VERYGLAEIRDWFFEVWNEPNLRNCWAGKRERRDLLQSPMKTRNALKAWLAPLRWEDRRPLRRLATDSFNIVHQQVPRRFLLYSRLSERTALNVLPRRKGSPIRNVALAFRKGTTRESIRESLTADIFLRIQCRLSEPVIYALCRRLLVTHIRHAAGGLGHGTVVLDF